MNWWISAFVLGLVGSTHCVVMCGPLVGGLGPKTSRFWLHHGGRLMGYVLLGLLAGGLVEGAHAAGLQRGLTLAMGGLLLLGALGLALGRSNPLVRWWSVRVVRLYPRMAKGRYQGISRLALGVLNGWLPCGLVYGGMALAISENSWWGSLGTMVAFGLGTLPIWLGMSSVLVWIKARRPSAMRWERSGWAMGLIGALLLLRGLSLGIPYLSPSAPQNWTADLAQTAGARTFRLCGGHPTPAQD